eukprot:scaffold421_cov333-Pavlova_lutheri.AAC.7
MERSAPILALLKKSLVTSASHGSTLHLVPPDMSTFFPHSRVRSSTSTSAPGRAAYQAAVSPAAPPPTTATSATSALRAREAHANARIAGCPTLPKKGKLAVIGENIGQTHAMQTVSSKVATLLWGQQGSMCPLHARTRGRQGCTCGHTCPVSIVHNLELHVQQACLEQTTQVYLSQQQESTGVNERYVTCCRTSSN